MNHYSSWMIILIWGFIGFGILAAIRAVMSAWHSRFLDQTYKKWRRRWQVDYQPIPAYCHGKRPQESYGSTYIFGALGIADRSLVFSGHFNHSADVKVPLHRLRWVGFRIIQLPDGLNVTQGPKSTDPQTPDYLLENIEFKHIHKNALIIHCEGDNDWEVLTFTFTSEGTFHFVQALASLSNLSISQHSKPEGFGPFTTTRMIQDIYGVWSKDKYSELYLAPDRLIFDWQRYILLKQICAVNVISIAGGDPVAIDLLPYPSDLLQIEYKDSAGKIQTDAYAVANADEWASKIRHQTKAPVEHFFGRKKKAKSS